MVRAPQPRQLEARAPRLSPHFGVAREGAEEQKCPERRRSVVRYYGVNGEPRAYPVSPEGATQRGKGSARVIRRTRRVCPVEEGAAAQECVSSSQE